MAGLAGWQDWLAVGWTRLILVLNTLGCGSDVPGTMFLANAPSETKFTKFGVVRGKTFLRTGYANIFAYHYVAKYPKTFHFSG